MPELSFPWIFISLAVVTDVVGLFYLWRRRQSAVGTSHRPAVRAAERKRMPVTDRRRRDRRGAGQAISA